MSDEYWRYRPLTRSTRFDAHNLCLDAITRTTAYLDLRLNGGALAEAGWDLDAGASQIHHALQQAGWQVQSPARLTVHDLRSFPSTWAKRLAFGRDPRAVTFSGRK